MPLASRRTPNPSRTGPLLQAQSQFPPRSRITHQVCALGQLQSPLSLSFLICKAGTMQSSQEEWVTNT